MKKVFISGSRRISRLNSDIKNRIDQMIEKKLSILVGDANGADKAVQSYLAQRQYLNVTVFCTAGECRNNLSEWPVFSVSSTSTTHDFNFFAAKDTAMARQADVGFMLWDSKSVGTIINVARMTAAGKAAVVYISPVKKFLTIRAREDLQPLLALPPADIRRKIEERLHEHVSDLNQPTLY